MTYFSMSEFGARSMLLTSAILAGAAFEGAKEGSAQGRLVCAANQAQYGGCCSEADREHQGARARARVDAVHACLQGKFRDDHEAWRPGDDSAGSKLRIARLESRSAAARGDGRSRDRSENSANMGISVAESQRGDCEMVPGKTGLRACGTFSVWVPEDWKITMDGEDLNAEDDDLNMAAGPITDTQLTDEEVTEFIDDELDTMNVTSDRRDKLDGFDVRLIDGTGTNEGEDVAFRALAIGTKEDVIEVVVYGSADDMQKNQATVERILRSLRPR